jgi:hypothetical protein
LELDHWESFGVAPKVSGACAVCVAFAQWLDGWLGL